MSGPQQRAAQRLPDAPLKDRRSRRVFLTPLRLYFQCLMIWTALLRCSIIMMRFKSILVVDDSEDTRGMLDMYLRSAGFAVEQAGTGAEAITKAKSLRP